MNKEEIQSVKWFKTVKEYMTDVQNALDTENYKPNTISYKKEINTLDTVINLIDKQNKMIDLMTEELSNIEEFNAEGIKQYFEKKVKESD